jgi:two-component system cell cycle sensor histidine kinase/response regulator CckA
MAPTQSGPEHDKSSSLGLASGRGETVLIVDDDPLVRSLTERVLTRLGYTVMAAADGAEAVELVGKEGNHVDLMLTDVIMPQQSGPALHQRILELQPDVKVIYMSGYTGDHIGDRASDAPLLTKPFTLKQLSDAIRAVLEGREVVQPDP